LKKKILYFSNSDWYLYNFRLALAKSALQEGYEVVFVSPPGDYVNRILESGIKWLPIRLSRRGVNPLGEIASLISLWRIVSQERPSIIHNFTIKCVLYGSFVGKLKRVGGVVNAITGLGYVYSSNTIFSKVLKNVVNIAYRNALKNTEVIFQNPDDEALLLGKKLVEKSKSHLIRGSGVDIEKFRPSRSNSEKKDICILLASRLLWSKGVGEYIEAAKKISNEMSQVIFQVAGDFDPGSPDAISTNTVKKWERECGNKVEFLGHCSNMDKLIAESDIVVLPSYYGEGVPRILIEAAASGKPLITTNMPGCKEIVINGVNGVLIEPRDSNELYLALVQLIKDSSLRYKMGGESRKLVCNFFSEEIVFQKTLGIYAGLSCR